MLQGELHRYCASANEGELRFNSQSQKASDTPPPQLPGNETDCGWAPFGEFSISPPVTVQSLKWAAPAGFSHGLAGLFQPCQFLRQ